MQSPAEVYTLAVSPVALPGPPHLQPPARMTGQTHSHPQKNRFMACQNMHMYSTSIHPSIQDIHMQITDL